LIEDFRVDIWRRRRGREKASANVRITLSSSERFALHLFTVLGVVCAAIRTVSVFGINGLMTSEALSLHVGSLFGSVSGRNTYWRIRVIAARAFDFSW
jgi:hypothetical protein